MSCGAGHRCGSDPSLLWLWCRSTAVALIRPLAWEPPYAAGVALKSKKKKKKYIQCFPKLYYREKECILKAQSFLLMWGKKKNEKHLCKSIFLHLKGESRHIKEKND